MKTRLTFCYVSFLFVAAVLIQGRGTNSWLSPPFEDSPTAVSTRFFDRSIGKKARDSLTGPSPESFRECVMLTVEDCRKQRETAAVRRSKPASTEELVFDLKSPREQSVSVGFYIESLEKGKVKLVRVVSENTAGAEARVRVDIDFGGERLTKDVLLFKESDWRVFEIVSVGDHVNYATTALPRS